MVPRRTMMKLPRRIRRVHKMAYVWGFFPRALSWSGHARIFLPRCWQQWRSRPWRNCIWSRSWAEIWEEHEGRILVGTNFGYCSRFHFHFIEGLYCGVWDSFLDRGTKLWKEHVSSLEIIILSICPDQGHGEIIGPVFGDTHGHFHGQIHGIA